MNVKQITAISLILFANRVIIAQTSISPERLEGIQTHVDQVKHTFAQLPQPFQRTLSGGALNAIAFAQHWDEIQKTFGEGPEMNARTPPAGISANATSPNTAYATAWHGVVPVSNPSTDFLFSVLAGFTQSETSSAWCGSNVVVGFNDSGSMFESLLFGPGGMSFSGAGVSTDAGMSFRNVGFINPGPNPLNFLEGDPVVHCTDPSTFYYCRSL
jgi:hypothetical protein